MARLCRFTIADVFYTLWSHVQGKKVSEMKSEMTDLDRGKRQEVSDDNSPKKSFYDNDSAFSYKNWSQSLQIF